MLFLNSLNGNFLQKNTSNLNIRATQQGSILIGILLASILITSLINYLFFSTLLHTKLSNSLLLKAQQFEAAEFGLLQGEKKLNQMHSLSEQTKLSIAPMVYSGSRITFTLIQLPHTFCFLPMQREGYYYQLTATAECTNSCSPHTAVSLQRTLALPGKNKCRPSLASRDAYLSAWCQVQ